MEQMSENAVIQTNLQNQMAISQSQQPKKSNWGLWIGLGIGGLVGGGIGYVAATKRATRKAMEAAEEELKRVKKRMKMETKAAYDQGTMDGTNETLGWMDRNVISVIEKQENGEELMAEIKRRADLEVQNGIQESGKSDEKAPDDSIYAEKEPKTAENDVKNVDSKGLKDPMEGKIEALDKFLRSERQSKKDNKNSDGQNLVNSGKSDPDSYANIKGNEKILEFSFKGSAIHYPASLFYDKNGESYGEIRVRQNLRDYEKDPNKLNIVWQALGWGAYVPDPEEMSDEELKNMNLDIDETDIDPEPEVVTREREKYMDLIDKYQAHPENAPQIISEQEFNDECHLDKEWFDYYEKDNAFVNNSDITKEIDDPFTYFGFSDGHDLFRKKYELDDIRRDDDGWNDNPGIVHIRNFNLNMVAEITRLNMSYEEVRNGRVYFNGNSGQIQGAGGV